MNWGITLVNASSVLGFVISQRNPWRKARGQPGRGRGLVLAPRGRGGQQLVLRREQQALASASVIGRRRRAAAIAPPSRVCAFSRARSLSSSAWKVVRSTGGGLPELADSFVMTVSSFPRARFLRAV